MKSQISKTKNLQRKITIERKFQNILYEYKSKIDILTSDDQKLKARDKLSVLLRLSSIVFMSLTLSQNRQSY